MKRVLLSSLLITPLVFAEIKITTLNDWEITSFDETSLLVIKTNDREKGQTKAILGFSVDRPYCFAQEPIVMLRTKKNTYSDGDIVYAKLKIDKNMPKYLSLQREFGFEEEGDEVNWFKLLKFPAISSAKRVEFIFKANIPLKNAVFNTEGIKEATYQSEKICNSPYDIVDVKSKERKI
tara:strand:+ start:706 stop:1242 length:537 start_codon:yes stop_codon:yes gene_type:complete